ncbi:integrase catalytic subunit [Pandoraea horticolens]|uniref:Integrase catalytic subunit n=1 Tax=Pandoraea horticolens TaxID=2508298 RepID=A0A5E4ZCZ8_9BURK|nr:integrase catalytic subunit [Pandoraea horticolens]
MKQRRRICYTETQKALMWERWRKDDSLQQIAGWLKHSYAVNRDYLVSHERSIRASTFKLAEHSKRSCRNTCDGLAPCGVLVITQKTDDHGRILGTVPISEHPASVEDQAIPGHWEGDLLCGSGGSQIATLVERHSRYVMLVRLTGKDSETAVRQKA